MNAKSCNKSTTPKKKLSLRSALGLAARISLLTTPVWAMPLIDVARSSIMFVSNFDSGFSEWEEELCCKNSAQIVSSPTRAGKGAIKFTHKKSDPSRRAEIRLSSVPANSEQWYGFSVFVPKEYTKDPSYEVITQWHSVPDSDLGETWRRPGLSLRTANDQFKIENHWDSNPVTKKIWDVPTQEWELGPIAKGQWTDWVFHAKWSYKSDGLLEVWKNGQLVVRKTGPNIYNDKKGPFLKMGIYKPEWKSNPERSTTTERVIYHDEVRTGDASSSYQDVAPKGSVTTSPGTVTPSPTPDPKVGIISEDFASSSTRFTEMSGDWSVSGGKYKLTKPINRSSNGNGNISVHNKSITGDFTLSADANVASTSDTWDDLSIIFNYQDANNYSYASFNETDNSDTNGIFKVSGGNVREIVDFASTITAGTNYSLKVEKIGSTIKIYRDDKLQGIATGSSFQSGKVGFGSRNNAATFDNLVVQQPKN